MKSVAQKPILFFHIRTPYGPIRGKCGAFDKTATNCTGVYRNLNLLLPLENKTV